jgi:hypothetical protein
MLRDGKTLVVYSATNVTGSGKEILKKRRERHDIGRKNRFSND